MANPFEDAVQRLKQETNRLRDDQMNATKDATYVGFTEEQSRRNDQRRKRISDLVMKIAELHQEEDPGTSTRTPLDRKRLEAAAIAIQQAPDHPTFCKRVFELNQLLRDQQNAA